MGLPRTRRRLFFALAVIAFGWAAPAAASGESSRFDRLRAQELRVADVAYRLARANRQWCRGSLAPQLGLVLHDLAQYGPDDRAGAARAYGMGSQIGVMAVVAGSPAATAGLRAGDRLEAVNGRVLATAAGGPPTLAFVERARLIFLAEMRKGAIDVRVSAGGVLRDVRFAAETGCRAAVRLVPGADVNAWADGDQVAVTDAILGRCATDDDLALLIAHELAHNLLHHRRRLALAGISDATPPVSAVALATVRATEEEADRFAVRMARAAGYDMRGAISFVGGLLGPIERSGAADTHPRAGRRLALLQAAISPPRAGL